MGSPQQQHIISKVVAATLLVSLLVTVASCRRVNMPLKLNILLDTQKLGKDAKSAGEGLTFTNGDDSDVIIPTNLIPRSSPRWIKCRSTMWITDCKNGSTIIATFKHIKEEGCEGFCSDEKDCKFYLYHDETANCALTSATLGTSRAKGISGPDLPLRKALRHRRYKGPAPEGTEDCTEFHFRDCRNENLPEDKLNKEHFETTWQSLRGTAETCAEECFGGHLRGMCRSFAFMDTPNTPGECGAHKHAQVDKLIYHNCRVVSGRVGDIDKGAKREMYDSCMFLMSFDKANNNDCRRGYCNLDHYEKIGEDSLTDEQKCKHHCYTYEDKQKGKICTHYEYYQPNWKDPRPKTDRKCIFYQVDSLKSVTYSCKMHAAFKGIQMVKGPPTNGTRITDLPTCLEDVTIRGGEAIEDNKDLSSSSITPVTESATTKIGLQGQACAGVTVPMLSVCDSGLCVNGQCV